MPTLSPKGFKILSQLRQKALEVENKSQRKITMNFLDCYKTVLAAMENSEISTIEDSQYLAEMTADLISFSALAAAPMVANGVPNPVILAQLTTAILERAVRNVLQFYDTVPELNPNEKVH